MTDADQDILQKTDSLKSDIDGHRPFSGHVVKQLRDYYRIGLTYTSNAIEGNTLTESETKVVIEDGITIGGKSLREHLEVVGHAKAYDHIYSLMERDISENDILDLHSILMKEISPEDAGRYREKNVIITGTDYLPPNYSKIPELMKKHIKNLSTFSGDKHYLEWACDIHSEFELIHPFTDGNGRIGRLILNILTIKKGYCPVIIPPIRRADYITALQKTNKGDFYTLREFVLNVVYEEMKSLQRLVESLVK